MEENFNDEISHLNLENDVTVTCLLYTSSLVIGKLESMFFIIYPSPERLGMERPSFCKLVYLMMWVM